MLFNYEAYVYFGIWNHLEHSADEISAIIGIEPKIIRQKGDKLPYSQAKYAEENCWKMESPFSKQNKHSPFEEHIDFMLDLLESKVDILAPICRNTYNELSIIMYLLPNEPVPSIHFDKRFIKVMHDLNIDVDFDIMILSNHSDAG